MAIIGEKKVVFLKFSLACVFSFNRMSFQGYLNKQ